MGRPAATRGWEGNTIEVTEKQASELFLSINPAEIGNGYAVSRARQVYKLVAPVNPYALTRSRSLLAQHSDLAEYRASIRSSALRRLTPLAAPVNAAASMALFDSVCDGCPSGEEFTQIIERSHAADERWLVFVPRDYRNLISAHMHTNVRLLPYSRSDEPFREILFDLAFLGFSLPMILTDEQAIQ